MYNLMSYSSYIDKSVGGESVPQLRTPFKFELMVIL
jgi:hypothetical protein